MSVYKPYTPLILFSFQIIILLFCSTKFSLNPFSRKHVYSKFRINNINEITILRVNVSCTALRTINSTSAEYIRTCPLITYILANFPQRNRQQCIDGNKVSPERCHLRNQSKPNVRTISVRGSDELIKLMAAGGRRLRARVTISNLTK